MFQFTLIWQWSQMIGSKRCGGKCDGQILLNFYIEENSFHRKNIKVPEKWSTGKFWQICFVLKFYLKEQNNSHLFIFIKKIYKKPRLIESCTSRCKKVNFIAELLSIQSINQSINQSQQKLKICQIYAEWLTLEYLWLPNKQRVFLNSNWLSR